MAIYKTRPVLLGIALLCAGATLLMAAPFRKPRYTRPSTPARPAPTANKPTLAPPAATKPSATTPAAATPSSTAPIPPQPKREPETPPQKSAAPEVKSQSPPITEKPTTAIPHPTSPATVKPAPTRPRTTELFSPPPIGEPSVPVDPNKKYAFRYQFTAGETVRWEVEHLAKIATTVDGSSQTAETTTISIKAWTVASVAPSGDATFVNAVDSIDMRQKISGRQEIRFNSRTDKEVPPIFQDAARQVGIPLAEITMDARGNVLKRVDKKPGKNVLKPEAESASAGEITLVLPDKPLAVGESFTVPFELAAVDSEGVKRVVKARRKLTLVRVVGDIAELTYAAQILSPLEDRALESQVAQSEQSGEVRFDLARGRIVELKFTNDRQVFGFQGEASMMHVQSEFNERLVDIPTAAAKTEPADRK